MKNSNEQKLKEVIQDLIDTYKLQDKITQTQLIQSWDKIAGSYIAGYTEKIYLHKNKLYIRISSPALKHELSFARQKLIDALNGAVQKQVIDEIIFL